MEQSQTIKFHFFIHFFLLTYYDCNLFFSDINVKHKQLIPNVIHSEKSEKKKYSHLKKENYSNVHLSDSKINQLKCDETVHEKQNGVLGWCARDSVFAVKK